MKEKVIQNNIMLAISNAGCTIFRNNCGVHKTEDGRFIRYGVANPGGSDLVGWTPVTITPDMVGHTVAVFTGVEVKTAKGRPTNAQRDFLAAINAAGGIGGIARSVDDALALVDAARSMDAPHNT